MSFPGLIAEVLDKEPDANFLWTAYGSLALVGFVACWRSKWFFLAFGPIAAVAAWAGLTELWDRFVGPAILHESQSLFVQWRLALAMGVAGPIAGLLRTRKVPETSASPQSGGQSCSAG